MMEKKDMNKNKKNILLLLFRIKKMNFIKNKSYLINKLIKIYLIR